MNRAYDQVLLDVALHRAAVTFVLDRAGVTGDDGPSHNGMWDLSLFQTVPGLCIAAPRDAEQLREQLREALATDDGPTMLRYPKGAVPAPTVAIERIGRCEILRKDDERDVLIVAVGSMVTCALDVAQRLTAQGIGVTVVDPRWVKPIDDELVGLARSYRVVVTVEDNLRVGGVGSVLSQTMSDHMVDVPVRVFGLPTQFFGHAKRDQVLRDCGLTAQDISRAVVELVAGLDAAAESATSRSAEPPARPN